MSEKFGFDRSKQVALLVFCSVFVYSNVLYDIVRQVF